MKVQAMEEGYSVLNIVTLFININTSIFNISEYNSTYLSSSFYSDINRISNEKYNYIDAYEFAKCCPISYIYAQDVRACVPFGNSSLNEEVFAANQLYECPVIVDRFVDNEYLKILPGNDTLEVAGDIYSRGKFCLDETWTQDLYVMRLCQEEHYCFSVDKYDSNDWCLHKCCPDSYSLTDYNCELTPTKGISVKDKEHIYENIDGYALLYSTNLKCSVANWLDFEQLNFTVKTNGQLVYNDGNKRYEIDEYCLDTMYDSESDQYVDMVILCEFTNQQHAVWILVKICVIISCICLIITIIIYIFVYKLQKLLQQIIFCFCVIDLIFWIMYCMRLFVVSFGSFCTIFAYIYFFVSIAQLAWLNVLSYEIWNLTGNPKARFGQNKRSLLKKLLKFGVYAMIIPAVFTLFFILGHEGVYSLSRKLKPFVNVVDCTIDTRGFGGNYGYIHIYIPVCILITINLIFFASTIKSFLKTRSDARNIVDAAPTNKEKLMKTVLRRGCLILKLALIMGITWIYYLVTYINKNFKDRGFLKIIEDILQILNLLEGLYLFLIFVVNWKTIKRILYKLHILKRRPSDSENDSNSTEFESGIAMKSL